MRFALTALGMVIGSASVILVVTIGLTGRDYALGLIEKIGTNMVELEYAGGGATGTESAVYNDYLTLEDERAVDSQVPSVMYSSPVLEMHERISFGGGVVKDTLVLGVVPAYENVRNLIVTDGRFMDDVDENAHIKCAVVTLEFAKQMFGSPDAAVGQSFEIQGIPFTIIGTFKESVDDFGMSEITDNTILVPYSVARYFTGSDKVKQIYFSLRSMDDVPDASKSIKAIVNARHKPNSVYKTHGSKVGPHHGRSHFEGLACHADRRGHGDPGGGRRGHHEYHAGQRACSHPRDRHSQSAGGDIAGDPTAVSDRGGNDLAGRWNCRYYPGPGAAAFGSLFHRTISIPISPWSIVAALLVSLVVGVIFGTVPATRAAQMDPVESLKYE